MICGNCGSESEGNFCPKCGNKCVEKEIFCSNCGVKCDSNIKFCTQCGTPIFGTKSYDGGIGNVENKENSISARRITKKSMCMWIVIGVAIVCAIFIFRPKSDQQVMEEYLEEISELESIVEEIDAIDLESDNAVAEFESLLLELYDEVSQIETPNEELNEVHDLFVEACSELYLYTYETRVAAETFDIGLILEATLRLAKVEELGNQYDAGINQLAEEYDYDISDWEFAGLTNFVSEESEIVEDTQEEVVDETIDEIPQEIVEEDNSEVITTESYDFIGSIGEYTSGSDPDCGWIEIERIDYTTGEVIVNLGYLSVGKCFTAYGEIIDENTMVVETSERDCGVRCTLIWTDSATLTITREGSFYLDEILDSVTDNVTYWNSDLLQSS